jgi:hypothetical protein
MAARQALEERSPASLGFRLVRTEDRVFDLLFRNAAAFELKFGMLVVSDHRPCLSAL